MTSLPPNLPPENQAVPAYASAYGICLTVEHALTNLLADTTKNEEEIRLHLVYVRILGYLLHFMPTRAGLDNLAGEIQRSSTSANDLVKLGKTYYDCFLRAYRSNDDGTPDVSEEMFSSPSEFETTADMMNDPLDLDTELHAIAKKKALTRDKFRCVLSGSYDIGALENNEELCDEYVAQNPRPPNTFTECAHILWGPISPNLEDNDYGADVWEFVDCFGCSDIRDELTGANIHRLENVMTLEPQLYICFTRLKLWLVATGEPNQYRTIFSLRFQPLNNQLVTFKTDDPVNLPVPSPAYLAIHAACAQVVHFSGADKYIEKYYEDMEELQEGMEVLSPDGSSASLLDDALRGV
ncbi:hypothetical protein D9613_008150 [Agrocybe pediades]|uniref:HNH nuclease domain-containing protein n=1 Tax=Agrocybe pediades TaxID=84607 RepID=A0A8H4QN63_9AGAR|nr:hypothetical protein D9613_008150 [Agrocybe pediades]KAF9542160.1 hypothetical protein CPC08DRAFT_770472 [Agrocybe pediades]